MDQQILWQRITHWVVMLVELFGKWFWNKSAMKKLNSPKVAHEVHWMRRWDSCLEISCAEQHNVDLAQQLSKQRFNSDIVKRSQMEATSVIYSYCFSSLLAGSTIWPPCLFPLPSNSTSSRSANFLIGWPPHPTMWIIFPLSNVWASSTTQN